MSERRKRRFPSTDSDSDDYLQWKFSRLKKRLATRARLRNQESVSPSQSYVSRSPKNQRSRSRQDSFSSPEVLVSDDDDVPLSVLAADGADTSASAPISAGT